MNPGDLLDELDDAFHSLGEGDVEEEVARIERLKDALEAHASPDLTREIRLRLAAAVTSDDFFGRDVYSDILVRLSGTDALPDLLAAGAVDLKDDQDSFNAVLWELLVADPEGCRVHVLQAARSKDGAIRREALYAMTFLPPAPGESSSALLCGLDERDDHTRELVACCVIGSDWFTADKDLARTIRTLATHDQSPTVRAAIRKALAAHDATRAN